jgi:hypothetical protein
MNAVEPINRIVILFLTLADIRTTHTMHNWKREQYTRDQGQPHQTMVLLNQTDAAPAATAHERRTPSRPLLAVERAEPLRWAD